MKTEFVRGRDGLIVVPSAIFIVCIAVAVAMILKYKERAEKSGATMSEKEAYERLVSKCLEKFPKDAVKTEQRESDDVYKARIELSAEETEALRKTLTELGWESRVSEKPFLGGTDRARELFDSSETRGREEYWSVRRKDALPGRAEVDEGVCIFLRENEPMLVYYTIVVIRLEEGQERE